MKKLRLMVDIAHPAHVHLFRNMIRNMQTRGHDVLITARDRDCIRELLDAYGLRYRMISSYKTGLTQKFFDMLKRDYLIYKIAKDFKPDFLVGMHSENMAHVGRLIGKPSIVFTQTEHPKLDNLLTFPVASVVCTPSCFTLDLGRKQVRYEGYHELAYLHPNRFTPNPIVLDELGLNKNDVFFVMRFVSWKAAHDVGHHGIRDKWHAIKLLEKHGRVFITSENRLSSDFDKYRITLPVEKIHSLLYYATMYFGDGGTMTSESSVLGTPAVLVSTSTTGYLTELEHKYDLAYVYTNPLDCEEKALKKVEELLQQKDKLKDIWRRKREILLKDKIDVTSWMMDFITRYPESYREYIGKNKTR